MLGAYTSITGAIPTELVERELQRRYQDNEKVLTRNLDAFRRGVELGKSAA
jgi:Pyruvate/2-oxoacid:ferredoxin oxidoreductase gamma subunit